MKLSIEVGETINSPNAIHTHNRHLKTPKIRDKCMAVSQAWVDGLPYHTYFACVWPTALKLGCVTNFDMLFLVMGFISLIDEIQFMLISSRHICIRSIVLPFSDEV